MKFAFAIFRYFPFGGLQRDMLAIAQEAIKGGHQVTIFCGEWQGEQPAGIEVKILSAAVLFNTAGIKSFMQGFEQAFQRNQFDLLVGFNKMPGLDVYFSGDSCFAQKAYESRHFFYRLTPRAQLYLDYEKAVFGDESNTHILSLVAAEQQHFSRYYGTTPARVHALPPGILREQIECKNPAAAQTRIRRELNLNADTRIILCLGSGFKTKGLDRSIAAFAILQKMIDEPVVLLVVGDDKSDVFRAQAKQLGVADKVVFVGGRTDVADILHSVDVLLHPAYRELAGNVILEAMLTGCPVVATDVCGFADYVVSQQMGAIVSAPYDAPQIAQKILDVLAINKSIWHERGERFAKTADVFSRAPQTVALMEKLAAGQYANAIVRRTSSAIVILRNEIIDHWVAEKSELPTNGLNSIFDRVKNLTGLIARDMPDRQTLRFEIAERGYYRKWHRGVGWREIIKNLLQCRLPVIGAKNEWVALNKLQALNIPSLIPVAYGEQGNNPATKKSFIVTRELTDVTQLDHYFEQQNPSFAQKRLLIENVAVIVRELHAAGINHRDLYLCHFMLNKASLETNKPCLYLIDLHRAQCRIQVPLRWQMKDLGALYFSILNLNFTRADVLRFLRIYFADELRNIITTKSSLLPQIVQRAIKTYRRDFGHAPRIHRFIKG